MTSMTQKFNEQQLAFFCSANEQYIPMALVTLLSVRKWHPHCGYFILADIGQLSAGIRKIAEEFSIELLDIGRTGPFESLAPEWPIECFFIIKGPELLHRRGYRYSVSLDGDVYCRRRMDLGTVLPRVSHWGGVRMFAHHPDPRMDLLAQEVIDEPVLDRAYANTGVLFWHNRALAEANWYAWCCDLYERCAGRGYRPPSDQHLLNLALCRRDIDFTAIPEEYNFRVCKPNTQRLVVDQACHAAVREGNRDPILLAHFVFCPKPWQGAAAQFCSAKQDTLWLNSAAYFYDEWRELAQECLGGELAGRWFGDGLARIPCTSAEVGGKPLSPWTKPVISRLAAWRRRLLLSRYQRQDSASAFKA